MAHYLNPMIKKDEIKSPEGHILLICLFILNAFFLFSFALLEESNWQKKITQWFLQKTQSTIEIENVLITFLKNHKQTHPENCYRIWDTADRVFEDLTTAQDACEIEIKQVKIKYV